MARIRTLKPELWQDEKLAPLDPITRLVFLGLICLGDDAGRLVDNIRLLDASIFPETADTCREALATLARIGRIRRGMTASGQRVLQIVNWERHQKVDHPNLKAALPEIVAEHAVTELREDVATDSRDIREAFAHHTNDLRPTTYDLRPTTADAAVASPAVEILTESEKPPRSAKATRPKAEPGGQWPAFTEEHCTRLVTLWRERLGKIDYGRFRKAFGEVYATPESARGSGAPTNAELDDALAEWLSSIPRGPSSPFASPEKCAERLAAIARVARGWGDDFTGRVKAIDTVVHGRREPKSA